MFAGKKSAQIREILISESAWEEMTCLFAPSLGKDARYLAETSDSYRVIYIRGNKINVEVVKCEKKEGYIRFPIENANDILKKPVPQGG